LVTLQKELFSSGLL